MKKLITGICAFALLATIASCNKEEKNFLNPHVHSYTLNSTSYNGGTYDALYTAEKQNFTTNLYVTENVSKYVRLSVIAPNGITPGTYKVGYDGEKNTTVNLRYSTGSKTYKSAYGTVQITEFDQNNSKAAGTFSFKAAAAAGDSMNVTLGSFENVYFVKN